MNENDIKTWYKENVTWAGNENTNRSTRRNCIPQIIVNHITEGSKNSVLNWFTNTANINSSTHFLVAKDGNVYQFVAIEDCAWGNGLNLKDIHNATAQIVKDNYNINPNAVSVSIENEGFTTDAEALTNKQLNSSIMLHKYIIEYVKEKYNHTIKAHRDFIIGHNEIDPIRRPNCPHKNFPFDIIIENILKENNYIFYDTKGHWAENLINQAYELKFITGYKNKYFMPDKKITRAEAVALIIALYNTFK